MHLVFAGIETHLQRVLLPVYGVFRAVGVGRAPVKLELSENIVFRKVTARQGQPFFRQGHIH